MDVLLANPRGFCAGVDRAIGIVEQALAQFGAPIYVRHEVVHNKFVVDDLRFVLITSAATVRVGDALAITVRPSAAAKCERCWHYRTDLGTDRAHPTLWARCVATLFGSGEPRRHA